MAIFAKKPVAAAVQDALPLISAAPPAETPAPAPQLIPDTPPPGPTPELNPRVAAMKEIAARANADADIVAAETMDTMDEDGNITPAVAAGEPGDGAPAEEPAPAEPASPTEPAEPQPAAAQAFNADTEYTLIVDGKPMKFKGSQIVEQGKATLQKQVAADQRLELASRLLLEAQARTQQPSAQDVAKQQAPAELTDEQLAEVIQFGTKEQAAQAIKMLRQPKGASTQDVLQQLAANLPKAVSTQIALNEGMTFATSEYGDLLSNPDIRQLFAFKAGELERLEPTLTPKEAVRKVGEEIRTTFNKPKPVAAAPAAAPQTLEAKRAAKAAAPAAPRLASARMEAAAPEKALTREQTLEKMARARGQGSPTQH